MKRLFLFPLLAIMLIACESDIEKRYKNMVSLRQDTLNVVHLNDSLVVYSGICRGCEYQFTVEFSAHDTAGIISFVELQTIDDNPPDMAGGSLYKNLIFAPQQEGNTLLNVYRFLNPRDSILTMEDSAMVQTYSIKIVE